MEADTKLTDEEIIAALARGLAVDALTGAQTQITPAIHDEARRQLLVLRDAGFEVVRSNLD